jgi:prophage tail gpP-like protein
VSPTDIIKVCALGDETNTSDFDFNWNDWTSCRISSGIATPAEASFELGDESGWDRIKRYCDLGAQFVVMVDDRPRFMGRVEALSATSDARQSATQSFVVRTKLSDAAYASAPQGLRLKGASIKQFVLACYEPLGLAEPHFDFRGDVSRDLMTGKSTRGGRPPKALEPLKEDQAKVNPPETIFSAVDRHLRRHGYLQWDGPDGRIVIAAPDDEQEPAFALCSYRPPYGQINNIKVIERVHDVSQSPTVLGIFGVGGSVSFAKTKISQVLYNQDLIDRGFRRNVVILDEALKTPAFAAARAKREYAGRNRALDRLTVTVDGLSYPEGGQWLPWAHDTVVDITAAQMGGAIGAYYVEDVEMTRNPADGDNTRMTLVKQGVWVL